MVRETRHLWVGNLPENIREDRIREHFKRYGRVQNVKLLAKSEGPLCAAVAFMDIKSASKAHNAEHIIDERQLTTDYYEPAAIPPSSAGSSPAGSASSGSVGSIPQATVATPSSRYDTRNPSSEDLAGVVASVIGPSTWRGTNDSDTSFARRGSTPAYQRVYRNGPTSAGFSPNERHRWYATGVESPRTPTPSGTVSDVVRRCRRSGSAAGSERSTSSSPEPSSPDSLLRHHHSRKGEQWATTNGRALAICVRNLPSRSSDSSLKDGLYHEYKKHGKVVWVKIIGQNQDRHAVVRFKKPSDVEKALEVSQDKLFFGCKISVGPHKCAEADDATTEQELDEYHPKATRTLFIGNLDKDITDHHIREKFKIFGRIVEVDVKKQSGVGPGYAFCQFANISSVVEAIRTLDGEYLGSSRMKLGFGKSTTTTCVWIDGLTEQSEKQVLSLVSRYGTATSVCVDRSAGAALVHFEQAGAAAAAVRELRRHAAEASQRLAVDFASRECQEAFYEQLEHHDAGRYSRGYDENCGGSSSPTEEPSPRHHRHHRHRSPHSSGDDRRRRHRRRRTERADTPLRDELPLEPRPPPPPRAQRPMSLPLPRFAARLLRSAAAQAPPARTITAPASPPRAHSPSASSSDPGSAPHSPSLEERIRSLDEKFERWSGSRGSSSAERARLRHRLLDLDIDSVKPSDVAKSLLAKRSVFDDDSERLAVTPRPLQYPFPSHDSDATDATSTVSNDTADSKTDRLDLLDRERLLKDHTEKEKIDNDDQRKEPSREDRDKTDRYEKAKIEIERFDKERRERSEKERLEKEKIEQDEKVRQFDRRKQNDSDIHPNETVLNKISTSLTEEKMEDSILSALKSETGMKESNFSLNSINDRILDNNKSPFFHSIEENKISDVRHCTLSITTSDEHQNRSIPDSNVKAPLVNKSKVVLVRQKKDSPDWNKEDLEQLTDSIPAHSNDESSKNKTNENDHNETKTKETISTVDKNSKQNSNRSEVLAKREFHNSVNSNSLEKSTCRNEQICENNTKDCSDQKNKSDKISKSISQLDTVQSKEDVKKQYNNEKKECDPRKGDKREECDQMKENSEEINHKRDTKRRDAIVRKSEHNEKETLDVKYKNFDIRKENHHAKKEHCSSRKDPLNSRKESDLKRENDIRLESKRHSEDKKECSNLRKDLEDNKKDSDSRKDLHNSKLGKEDTRPYCESKKEHHDIKKDLNGTRKSHHDSRRDRDSDCKKDHKEKKENRKDDECKGKDTSRKVSRDESNREISRKDSSDSAISRSSHSSAKSNENEREEKHSHSRFKDSIRQKNEKEQLDKRNDSDKVHEKSKENSEVLPKDPAKLSNGPIDKQRHYSVDSPHGGKRKERLNSNSSLPSNLGSKRRMSSHEALESFNDDIKKAKTESKAPPRRESRDSKSNEKSKTKLSKGHFAKLLETKIKEDVKNQTITCDIDQDKSSEFHVLNCDNIVNIENECFNALSKECFPSKCSFEINEIVSPIDFLANFELRSSEEDEKQKAMKKEMRERKRLQQLQQIQQFQLQQEELNRLKEKNKLEERKKDQAKEKRMSFERKSKEDKNECKKKTRRLGQSSETSDSDEPKKHSIFDIVDEGPTYISMYDKVKARSCKNMQKQEQEKRQEKIKAKFTQLKQNRAKREEKKRWDEDSDSDDDLKKPLHKLINSSSEDERKQTLRCKIDVCDSENDFDRLKSIESNSYTKSNEAYKLNIRRNSRPSLISDSSEDDARKKSSYLLNENMFRQNSEENQFETSFNADAKFCEYLQDSKETMSDLKHKIEIETNLETNNDRKESLETNHNSKDVFSEITSQSMKKESNASMVNGISSNMHSEIQCRKMKKTHKKSKSSVSEDDMFLTDTNELCLADKEKREKTRRSSLKKERRKEKRRNSTHKDDFIDCKSKSVDLTEKNDTIISRREEKMEDIFGPLTDDSDIELKESDIKEENLTSKVDGSKPNSDYHIKDEHRRRKHKRNKEKAKSIFIKEDENSLDVDAAGKAIEASLFAENLSVKNEPTEQDVFRFTDGDDSLEFSLHNGDSKHKRDVKEKRKKKKRSKEERHNRRESEGYSCDLPVDCAASPRLPMLADHTPPPSPPKSECKKMAENYIPGFGTDIDETISESAVKSISTPSDPLSGRSSTPEIQIERAPEEKQEERRVVISQEETEDAVAALLGESFGADDSRAATPASERELQIDTDAEDEAATTSPRASPSPPAVQSSTSATPITTTPVSLSSINAPSTLAVVRVPRPLLQINRLVQLAPRPAVEASYAPIIRILNRNPKPVLALTPERARSPSAPFANVIRTVNPPRILTTPVANLIRIDGSESATTTVVSVASVRPPHSTTNLSPVKIFTQQPINKNVSLNVVKQGNLTNETIDGENGGGLFFRSESDSNSTVPSQRSTDDISNTPLSSVRCETDFEELLKDTTNEIKVINDNEKKLEVNVITGFQTTSDEPSTKITDDKENIELKKEDKDSKHIDDNVTLNDTKLLVDLIPSQESVIKKLEQTSHSVDVFTKTTDNLTKPLGKDLKSLDDLSESTMKVETNKIICHIKRNATTRGRGRKTTEIKRGDKKHVKINVKSVRGLRGGRSNRIRSRLDSEGISSQPADVYDFHEDSADENETTPSPKRETKTRIVARSPPADDAPSTRKSRRLRDRPVQTNSDTVPSPPRRRKRTASTTGDDDISTEPKRAFSPSPESANSINTSHCTNGLPVVVSSTTSVATLPTNAAITSVPVLACVPTLPSTPIAVNSPAPGVASLPAGATPPTPSPAAPVAAPRAPPPITKPPKKMISEMSAKFASVGAESVVRYASPEDVWPRAAPALPRGAHLPPPGLTVGRVAPNVPPLTATIPAVSPQGQAVTGEGIFGQFSPQNYAVYQHHYIQARNSPYTRASPLEGEGPPRAPPRNPAHNIILDGHSHREYRATHSPSLIMGEHNRTAGSPNLLHEQHRSAPSPSLILNDYRTASLSPGLINEPRSATVPRPAHSPASDPRTRLPYVGRVTPPPAHGGPAHASQVPREADSLQMLLRRYPVMWQGMLALKTDAAAVQMHFVGGNVRIAGMTLPRLVDGSTPPLRISQRMRLEPAQLDAVRRKMQMESEHCMLLALPCGRDHMDVLQQSTNLSAGFITYLQRKQAAGIVNVAPPGHQQPLYTVHVFPSCEFANENLNRIAPDLLHRVADIAHLLILIATV